MGRSTFLLVPPLLPTPTTARRRLTVDQRKDASHRTPSLRRPILKAPLDAPHPEGYAAAEEGGAIEISNRSWGGRCEWDDLPETTLCCSGFPPLSGAIDVFKVLRGTIVNRTYGTHKNLKYLTIYTNNSWSY